MRYVRTTLALRSLHSVLKQWTRLNRNIGREWSKYKGNVPWWYNERALLSIFAGAVWLTRGYAFEESSELKHAVKRGRKGNGRVDLWFETSAGEFRAEAKHAEISITNKGRQAAHLNLLIGKAIKDAARNPADGGNSKRLAVAFAVPYYRTTISKEKQKTQLSWFLSLAKEVNHDAIAWIFPPLKKPPVANGYICPGIVVWIKLVKRR